MKKELSELRCDARQWEQRRQVAARGVQQDGERRHPLGCKFCKFCIFSAYILHYSANIEYSAGERQHQLCLREKDRVRLQQQHRLGWQEVIRTTRTTTARSSGQE